MTETELRAGQIPFHFGHFDSFDFALFVPGVNKDVYQKLQQITPMEDSICIYLWGQPGTGKSHLLHATCKAVAEAGGSTAYVPLAQCNEIEPGLLQGLGSRDLVCIDDIDRISGDRDWELALLHLYNQLRDDRHSIIIAGHTAPKAIELQLQDLKSRLSWGLTYRLKQLADETKIAILKMRARNRAFELPDEVASFLLNRVGRDMPNLMSILDRLDTASLAAQRKITIPFVKALLKE
ncbi:MAG: DnaA regulatory inactivator Hda [Gammaproteobacteria bacterium]